jgi:hypothetical protein
MYFGLDVFRLSEATAPELAFSLSVQYTSTATQDFEGGEVTCLN